MSNEAVQGFMAKINQDPALAEQVLAAFSNGENLDLQQLASQHGFAFSREEGMKVFNEVLDSGELSDVMLEAVAGGNSIDCNPNSNGAGKT